MDKIDIEVSPEYIYSVTEELLKEIQQALDYAWNNFDTYIDPCDIEAIMNDPLINNPTPEMLGPPPPPPPQLIVPNIGDDNVYKKFEELDFRHRELMDAANQVEKAVDYLAMYYYLRKDGFQPLNYDKLVSTVEWFADRMDVLRKSYREKLGINRNDILRSDNANDSCLDLMIHKFRQMKLMKNV